MIRFDHFNFNVFNLDASLAFYKEALDLEVMREKTGADGSYKQCWLGDKTTGFQLELTYNVGREKGYDLGECEYHLAFRTDRYDAYHERHKEMGCIAFENEEFGIYFITDPDGYWIEILPE